MSRDFDGVDDVIEAGSAVGDDLAVFTYAAWIFPDSFGEGSLGRIVEKGTGTSAQKRFMLNDIDANDVLMLYVERATTDSYRLSNTTGITLGGWQFVACTYDDAATNDISLFRGTPTALATEMTYAATQNGSGTPLTEAADNWRIGNASTGARTFDGRIAHVAVWNVVLTVEELRMFQLGWLPRPQNQVSFWPLFGEQSPEPDWSGNNNHGAVTGAVRIDHPPMLAAEPWRGARRVQRVAAAPPGGVTYPQLERGVRGLHRGLTTGACR